MIKKCTILLGILLYYNSVTAVNYYINDAVLTDDHWCSAAGVDALGRGTQALPLASLTYLYANQATYPLTAGDTVFIDKGTYTWTQATMPANCNGTAANPIAIVGANSWETIITVNSAGYSFNTNGNSYISFKGFTLSNNSAGNTLMIDKTANGTSTYCTVSNCKLTNTYNAVGAANYAAMSVYNQGIAAYNTIDSCVISSTLLSIPIQIKDVQNTTVSRCIITSGGTRDASNGINPSQANTPPATRTPEILGPIM